jgi:hypothetical protein
MSVKFEQETVKKVQNVVEKAAESGPIPGTKGKHPIAAAVGAALTGGRENAGAVGYLAVCHLDDCARIAMSRSSVLYG